MAHDLMDKVNGTGKAMFYVGETPWHGLGTKLDDPASAAEAIDAAGLGYEVRSLPMFADRGIDGPIAVPTHFLNVRSDDLTPLGVVSDRYKVVQNRECFGFLDSVVADGGIRYETAGAFGVGERIWMLGLLPGDLRVGRTDDVLKKYVLLYNSHDGSSALRCHWTPTRVVCWNTCSAALMSGEGTGITIRHTGDLAAKVGEAQRALGLAVRYYDDLQARIDFLAAHEPTRGQLDAYFRALYPDPKKGENNVAKTTRMTLFGLYERGMGMDMPGVKGTTWAAYNAVTEFVDHHAGRAAKGPGSDLVKQKRLASNWYGDGARAEVEAFDLALKLAEGKLEATPSDLVGVN